MQGVFEDVNQHHSYSPAQHLSQNIPVPQQIYDPPTLSNDNASTRRWDSSGSPDVVARDDDDDQEEGQRNSSSDEKGNGAPALSKRKAQNRAAYVLMLTIDTRVILTILANAHSGNAKRKRSKISKPKCNNSLPNPQLSSLTTSA